jgi:hypothetical protein
VKRQAATQRSSVAAATAAVVADGGLEDERDARDNGFANHPNERYEDRSDTNVERDRESGIGPRDRESVDRSAGYMDAAVTGPEKKATEGVYRGGFATGQRDAMFDPSVVGAPFRLGDSAVPTRSMEQPRASAMRVLNSRPMADETGRRATATAASDSATYAGKMWARLVAFARHVSTSAQEHAYVRSMYVEARQPPARVAALLLAAWLLNMQRAYCDIVIGLLYPTQGAYQSLKNIGAGRVQVGALVAWLQYFVFYALWTLLAERFIMFCGATFPDFYYVLKTLILFALYRPGGMWMGRCFTHVVVPIVATQERLVFRVMGQALNMHVTGDPDESTDVAPPLAQFDTDVPTPSARATADANPPKPMVRRKQRPRKDVSLPDGDRRGHAQGKVVQTERDVEIEDVGECARPRSESGRSRRSKRTSSKRAIVPSRDAEESESRRDDRLVVSRGTRASRKPRPELPRRISPIHDWSDSKRDDKSGGGGGDGENAAPTTLPEMVGQSARVMVRGLLGDLQHHIAGRSARATVRRVSPLDQRQRDSERGSDGFDDGDDNDRHSRPVSPANGDVAMDDVDRRHSERRQSQFRRTSRFAQMDEA